MFFFCAVPCAFFCGYVCAFLFVFFFNRFFFSGNHVWLFVVLFCAFCGALFRACVWQFVVFFVLVAVFFLLACLLVCAVFWAFMFSSRLGKLSLVSDLLCLCPTQCRPAGRLSVLSVHP